LTLDVACNSLGDSLPLVSRDLDAADGCDDLNESRITLADALLTDFSASRSVPSSSSFKEDLLGGVTAYQR